MLSNVGESHDHAAAAAAAHSSAMLPSQLSCRRGRHVSSQERERKEEEEEGLGRTSCAKGTHETLENESGVRTYVHECVCECLSDQVKERRKGQTEGKTFQGVRRETAASAAAGARRTRRKRPAIEIVRCTRDTFIRESERETISEQQV